METDDGLWLAQVEQVEIDALARVALRAGGDPLAAVYHTIDMVGSVWAGLLANERDPERMLADIAALGKWLVHVELVVRLDLEARNNGLETMIGLAMERLADIDGES